MKPGTFWDDQARAMELIVAGNRLLWRAFLRWATEVWRSLTHAGHGRGKPRGAA
jgi:hypothetical protein